MGARGRTPEEADGPDLLRELTEQTGGRDFEVDNIGEMPDVAAKIGLELRNQYVLGYSPKNKDRDGKFRRDSGEAGEDHRIGANFAALATGILCAYSITGSARGLFW